MRKLLKVLIVAVLLCAVVFPAGSVMAASGTRTMPSTATAGSSFDIDISVSDYGAFGQVVETLPAGFSYVSCSALSEAAVDVEGQEVKFTLLEEDTDFTYTVTASGTPGTYTFSGIIKDEDLNEDPLGSDTQIIVPATRSMPSSVSTGANFDIDISTFYYGAFGQVVETLPNGFSYVGSTLSEAAVDVEGQVVKFTLLDEADFSYTVAASSTTGTYTFSGILKDENLNVYDIGGDTQITVTTTAAPSNGGGGGGGGGEPTYYTRGNLFGTSKSYRISSDGEIKEKIEVTSADGKLTLTVDRGTIALGKDGKRLKTLETAIDESPPDPPEDAHIISLAYDFGPDECTFDPAITLTWSYDASDLPGGVAEEDVAIAFYDEDADEWVELDSEVDTEENTITASVSHFTTFAIIGTVKPATFTPSSLVVSPTQVPLGEKVNISVSVANTGGTEGSYTVVLNINGVKEAEKRVTIAAGKSQMVSFSATKEEAGTYNVDVDGLSGSFTVVIAPPEPEPEEPATAPEPEEPATAPEPEEPAPEPEQPEQPEPTPTPWPLIGGIIGGAIVVGLVIFFLVRRRAE